MITINSNPEVFIPELQRVIDRFPIRIRDVARILHSYHLRQNLHPVGITYQWLRTSRLKTLRRYTVDICEEEVARIELRPDDDLQGRMEITEKLREEWEC